MTQADPVATCCHQGAVVAGAKLDPGALRGRVHLMLLANLRQLFTHILLELLEHWSCWVDIVHKCRWYWWYMFGKPSMIIYIHKIYDILWYMKWYHIELGGVWHINMYQRNVYKCGVVSPGKGRRQAYQGSGFSRSILHRCVFQHGWKFKTHWEALSWRNGNYFIHSSSCLFQKSCFSRIYIYTYVYTCIYIYM